MASTASPTRAYPKRKRAQVKYYESSSEDSGGDDSDVFSVEEGPTNKKLKAKTTKAKTSRPLPPKKIFPFASLPAELKNLIYEMSLTDENGIHLISKTRHYRRTVQRDVPSFDHSSSTRARRRKRQSLWRQGFPLDPSPTQDESTAPVKIAALVPNILLLNREIYAEARPILYGTNEFFLEDTTALHNFLATIGPQNRAILVDLTVKGWGYSKAHKAMNHPAFTLLAGAVNIQRLRMDCKIHWGGGPHSIATQFYRESFHFLQGVGSAKGKFDAAVELIEIPSEHFERYGYRLHGKYEPPTYEEDMEEFRSVLRKLLSSG